MENNPLTRWDPTGHSVLDPGKVILTWNKAKNWVADKYEQYKEWKTENDQRYYDGTVTEEELQDWALMGLGTINVGRWRQTV